MAQGSPRRPRTALTLVLAALAVPAAPGDPAPSEEGEEAAKTRVYWKDGKTVLEAEKVHITLSNRVQFRLTQEFPDDQTRLPGTASPGDSRGSFRIRRAKTTLEGWLWRKELQFELQLGWAGTDSGALAGAPSGTFSGLEDALLTWDASRKGTFQITVGQFKVPFGRQELTSSERQQFVDRSILSGEFTRSRDVGVQVSGTVVGGKLAYAAGIFNGNGRNQLNNDNDKYQLDARVTLQPNGDVGYSEGDFESTDKPLFAVTGEVEVNDTSGATNTTDFKTTILGADAVFKYKGLSVFAEYFSRERDPETGSSFHSDGYHVQAGYFVQREKVEVAFRYARWDPSDAIAGNDRSEVGGALSFFAKKHNLKVQLDVRRLEDEARDASDVEVRIQTQFVF
jgi:phosphate-selective porin